MEQLDTIDRKILSELDRDSRQAYSAIAKKVRAKKDTVKYRINKLRQDGIIEGFYTVINYSKLGFLLFRLYIQTEGISEDKKLELLTYLKEHKNVNLVFRITGRYNFSFDVWVRDIWEYEKFWYGLIEKFGVYFSNYHSALKTRYTEFSRNYLAEDGKEKLQFTISQKTEKEDLDELDFRILTTISKNARESLVNMAKKAGTSVVTARERLRQLIRKKVIVGFRTMLNYEKLGYQYYKVDLWFNNMENYTQIIQRVLSHPNVIYTERTLVTSHFEFDLEVKDFRQFISIMDEFEKEFPEDIKRYEYYTLIKNYKTNYLPSL
ncbi:MAG: winged helix-turn-helix transcriptional regulator [Candidatus Micrarchaeota archaeon]|nr:winged helix-turn-helix transcriptional regulator [Candidatus Micrarchaeota archaeon]